MTTYDLCKKVVLASKYQCKEDMQKKFDVFLTYDRISADQYEELTKLLAAQTEDKAN